MQRQRQTILVDQMLMLFSPWAKDFKGIISLDEPLRRWSMDRLICFITVCITSLPYASRPCRSHLGRCAAHLIVSAAQAHCPRLFADISDERARLQNRQMDQDVPQDRQVRTARPTKTHSSSGLWRFSAQSFGSDWARARGYHRAQARGLLPDSTVR